MSLKSERHVKDASACLSKALTGPDFNLEVRLVDEACAAFSSAQDLETYTRFMQKVEASIEELPKIDTVLDASLEVCIPEAPTTS